MGVRPNEGQTLLPGKLTGTRDSSRYESVAVFADGEVLLADWEYLPYQEPATSIRAGRAGKHERRVFGSVSLKEMSDQSVVVCLCDGACPRESEFGWPVGGHAAAGFGGC